MQMLSSFVGTAESSTKLPWKSLDKRVGAEGVDQSHSKTSCVIDELYALQSLVPTWDTLRDVTVADTVGCLLFWGSVVLTRHPQRLLGTGGRGSQEG